MLPLQDAPSLPPSCCREGAVPHCRCRRATTLAPGSRTGDLCQKKKAKGCHCISAFRLLGFGLRQYTPELLQFFAREEPFAVMLRVALDELARICVPIPHPPGLGKRHHLRKNVECPVGLVWNMCH